MTICNRLFTSSVLLGACLVLVGLSSQAAAIDRGDLSSKVLYQAVDQLTDYLAKDLAEVSQHTKKTAIINYTQSEELPTSIQHYLTKRLEYIGSHDDRTPVKFLQCMECTALQAVAEGDEIFIRKGITDEAQLKEVMKKLGIRKYSDVNLAYTGDQLVMQVSLVDEEKLVDWSQEYRTPYKAYNDSQWVLGGGAEVGAFVGGADMPASKGARLQFGQRITGVGAVGLNVSFFEEQPGVPQIISLGSFFGLSHNEVFDQYWDFLRLSYQFELGATDFNGTQLLHEAIGIKTVLGKYYSIALNTKLHQFIQTPKESTPIENPDGEPVLNNDEVLPMMVSLVLGIELM